MKLIFFFTLITISTLGHVHVNGEANVEKFIMLETESKAACHEKVKGLVDKFTKDIMDDMKALFQTTKEDTSLLEVGKRGPGLKSLLMGAVNNNDEEEEDEDDDKEKEEEKTETQKVQMPTTTVATVETVTASPAVKDQPNATTDQHSVIETFSDAESKEMIAKTHQAYNKVEKTNAEAAKMLSSMKTVAPESQSNLQDVLDLVKDVLRRLIRDCKNYEYIDEKYCKIAINEKSLRSGIADLKEDVKKCIDYPDEECIIRNPFPKPELEVTDTNNFHSEFIEVLLQMNERAMVSEEEKLILQSTLSGKSRSDLVDAALNDNSIKKAIADKKHAPTLFKKLNLSDVEVIDNLFAASNDTHKIETAIDRFESKYEKPQKGGTLASADINAEDKRENFDEKLIERKCELGNEYISMQCETNERRQTVESCFKHSKFDISKDENETYQWTVTNASSGLCGRPKYFDVSRGMNGARVYLDSLISSDSIRKDITESLGKGLQLKALKDTCGNDGHETATVSIAERDRQYEVFIKIKCNSNSCSKYICDGNEGEEKKPVSEILLAYKLPGKCTKWNVFGRARVIGTSVTVHGQCKSKRDGRRSLLSMVGGDRSSGGCC